MPPGDDSSRLEQLTTRVEELERRLSALENASRIRTSDEEPAEPSAAGDRGARAGMPAPAQLSVFSIFGRAVLGIAGAYLLRAVAESGSLPQWIPVALAVVYSGAWLVWAARPSEKSGLARHVYGITAALIFSPMLWEVTVRFGILEPPVAATLVTLFALLGLALAWRSTISSVVWVGMLTGVITALVLMAATRTLVPFSWALLAMAILSEVAAVRGRWPILRPVVAAAADFAIVTLIIILGDSAAIPSEYRAVGEGVMIALVAGLFAIYAVSLTVRSLILRLKIRRWEAAQFGISVLVPGWAVVRVTNGAGTFALGACCLVAGALCYVGAYGLLARHKERPDFAFYATWGVIFVMAGSFLALPKLPLAIWLCVAAVLAMELGLRARSTALIFHGVAFLGGAVVASGLAGYAGRALAGADPAGPQPLPIAATGAALLCAGIVLRHTGEGPVDRFLRLMPAILAVYGIAAFGVSMLIGLVGRGAGPTLPELAVIRTMVTCVAALLLAFAGARWKRLELVWMAYGIAVLGSVKLAFEDMRFGSTQSLAASLLIYGAVLILIPRLVRAGKRWA